jgi:hypothetical protein
LSYGFQERHGSLNQEKDRAARLPTTRTSMPSLPGTAIDNSANSPTRCKFGVFDTMTFFRFDSFFFNDACRAFSSFSRRAFSSFSRFFSSFSIRDDSRLLLIVELKRE